MDKNRKIEIVLNLAIVTVFLSFGVWVIPVLIRPSSPVITNVELLANIKVLFYQLILFDVGLNTLVREIISPLIKARKES